VGQVGCGEVSWISVCIWCSLWGLGLSTGGRKCLTMGSMVLSEFVSQEGSEGVPGGDGVRALVCFVVYSHLPKMGTSVSVSSCLSVRLVVRGGEGAWVEGEVSFVWEFGVVDEGRWSDLAMCVEEMGDVWSDGRRAEAVEGSGGFLGGRALLGPGPAHQVLPLHFFVNASNSVSFPAGISSLLTWLGAFVQSAKQKPRMNQRGHILQDPSQSTLSASPLLAK